jgi:asparagine synthase (glutamine-hydrolysing)
MCGIVGVCTLDPPDDFERVVVAMTAALRHRGPDEDGYAINEPDGIALGMRRLSILDLAGGRQPMWNETRDHCVVFNGEIYNAANLRTELTGRGHRFVSDHSDTEVLVHGFEEWGEELFRRLNGMFAVAVWDRHGRRLVLARDRAGEKPLYLADVAGGYAFASELKALFRYPGLNRELDAAALEEYLAFDYILGPRTILQHVRKLPAGSYAEVTHEGVRETRYWSPRFVRSDSDEEDLLEEFDSLLSSSVSLRMVADVPIGLLLSGGLDSTTVGWFMRQHSDQVTSFSIGFEEQGYDESRYSSLAARALGTEHHLEVLSQQRALELVPRIAEILDEPMGDQSILPTLLLSEVTRREVTVALGGDGSDELLMGYQAYRALRPAYRFDAVPAVAARVAAGVARRAPNRLGTVRLPGVRLARTLDAPPAHRLLAFLGSLKGDARWLLSRDVRASLHDSVWDRAEAALDGIPTDVSPAEQTIATYLRTYLQEDILVKTDRASMACSLELRTPFLDPRLIDFLLAVPSSLKLRRRTPKYLLRRLMRDRLPATVIERRKVGFAPPLGAWLRTSLAPLVRDYLSPERLASAGIFEPRAVERLIRDHLDDRRDHGHALWLLLQFELWRERWLSADGASQSSPGMRRRADQQSAPA